MKLGDTARSNEFVDETFCCQEACTALLADDLHRVMRVNSVGVTENQYAAVQW